MADRRAIDPLRQSQRERETAPYFPPFWKTKCKASLSLRLCSLGHFCEGSHVYYITQQCAIGVLADYVCLACLLKRWRFLVVDPIVRVDSIAATSGYRTSTLCNATFAPFTGRPPRELERRVTVPLIVIITLARQPNTRWLTSNATSSWWLLSVLSLSSSSSSTCASNLKKEEIIALIVSFQVAR